MRWTAPASGIAHVVGQFLPGDGGTMQVAVRRNGQAWWSATDAGSFDVVVEDGTARARYTLNRAYYGLYLPPMVWLNLENFSSNSVALALCSQPFDEADYYRDREAFLHVSRAALPVA